MNCGSMLMIEETLGSLAGLVSPIWFALAVAGFLSDASGELQWRGD